MIAKPSIDVRSRGASRSLVTRMPGRARMSLYMTASGTGRRPPSGVGPVDVPGSRPVQPGPAGDPAVLGQQHRRLVDALVGVDRHRGGHQEAATGVSPVRARGLTPGGTGSTAGVDRNRSDNAPFPRRTIDGHDRTLPSPDRSLEPLSTGTQQAATAGDSHDRSAGPNGVRGCSSVVTTAPPRGRDGLRRGRPAGTRR